MYHSPLFNQKPELTLIIKIVPDAQVSFVIEMVPNFNLYQREWAELNFLPENLFFIFSD